MRRFGWIRVGVCRALPRDTCLGARCGAHGADGTRADEDAVIQFSLLAACFGGIVRHNQMRISIPIPKAK